MGTCPFVLIQGPQNSSCYSIGAGPFSAGTQLLFNNSVVVNVFMSMLCLRGNCFVLNKRLRLIGVIVPRRDGAFELIQF